MAALLAQDPDGLIVLIDTRRGGRALSATMEAHLTKMYPNVASRFRILATQGPPRSPPHRNGPAIEEVAETPSYDLNLDFMALLAVCDVMLDPFPYGGGISSLEGFSMGSPLAAG